MAAQATSRRRRQGRRGNPDSDAAAMYQSFHGAASENVEEFEEREHYHGNLAELGTLIGLKVRTVNGEDVTIKFSEDAAGRSENSSKGKFGGSPYRGTFEDLDGTQKKTAYREYLRETGGHDSYNEFIKAVADFIDWDTRTGKPWGMTRSNPFWPFNSFTRTEIYHVGTGDKFTAKGQHKGYTVYQDNRSGEYAVPAIERESRFDGKREATQFIDSWVKARKNPPFDAVRAQQLQNDIQEGIALLRNKKLTQEKRAWIERTIEDAKRKLALLKSGNPSSGPVGHAIGGFYSAAKKVGGYLDGQLGKVVGNPDIVQDLRYFLQLAADDNKRFLREFKAGGGVIEKEIPKQFIAGAGSSLPQYTVVLPDGHRGYFVPRRGMPGGKQEGKVWYEWHSLGRKSNPSGSSNVTLLCSNEDGSSLYFVGGDQEVDLKSLSIPAKDSTVIGEVWGLCYHTTKDFDDHQPIDYAHQLGDEKHIPKIPRGGDVWDDMPPPTQLFGSGELPTLIYDNLNHRLSLSGGIYKIERPLLETSPGIEN